MGISTGIAARVAKPGRQCSNWSNSSRFHPLQKEQFTIRVVENPVMVCDLIQKNLVTSLIGHFPEMATVSLIHPQERAELSYRLLVHKGDLFSDDPRLANSPTL
jgi:hypothetical protein